MRISVWMRISVEEFDLLGKKQVMEKMLQQRRSTEVEEGETQLLLGVVSLGWRQLGLEAPRRRMISFCQKWEFSKKIWRKNRDPLAKTRRHRRKEEQ